MSTRTQATDRDELISEAHDGLTDWTHALAEQVAATERGLAARHRMAAALARLAHPTPPLRLVDSDDEEPE